MLVLFETPAGYAFFKLQDEKKLNKLDKVWTEFENSEKTDRSLQLVSFKEFKSVNDALNAANIVNTGNMTKTLTKALKKQFENESTIAVGDTKIGSIIKSRFENVTCLYNTAVDDLMRGIREHADVLLEEQVEKIKVMRLALAHSLGRYKVKFNPEKIDTMIVQAVSLLDDIDKELNNYSMRLREWYGWHFPELGKAVQDHLAYAKAVKVIGMKHNALKADLSEVLTEDLCQIIKKEAEISMGSDISDLDLDLIKELCDQVIELTEYRAQLYEYLKNRMHALAPNLTVLLGELIGARLVSRAGTLVNLAKLPSSTVQLLGAEKALFRALKTKKDTPKYGIIYHAQLISQTSTQLKGKIARKLAAKVSICTRLDALRDESLSNERGIQLRASLEQVIKAEQERPPKRFSGARKAPAASYGFKKETKNQSFSSDFNFKKNRKRPFSNDNDEKTESMDLDESDTKPKKKTMKEE